MDRVEVKPELLRWARQRARALPETLAGRFPRLDAWERGEAHPTLKQLEAFAKATRTPVGYLFLPEPPVERIPLPDFRTIRGEAIARPSPDLLDTVYLCQQRQDWYRDYARSMGEEPLDFVGSVTVTDDIVETAARMRTRLGMEIDERRRLTDWTEALRRFLDQADALGVLVMVSGVVGSNNTRKLDVDEFRGFAIADRLAPLIFVNGADTKAAQMFTLAHELAHIWLGQSAISDAEAAAAPDHRVERWCNRVAAELLVPLAAMRKAFDASAEVAKEVLRLAREFKVSTLVVLRRIHDLGGMTREELWKAYAAEVARLRALPASSGGDFHRTTSVRVSKRFARAVVVSALEGRASFTESLRLLGVRKLATFYSFAHSLGIGA